MQPSFVTGCIFQCHFWIILLIHHLQGLPPVWRKQWKGWRPNVHHGPPGPHVADICMADTRFLSSAFGFCCEVKFTLLKTCTRFLSLLWKVVISIIFQYVYFKLWVCFLLFYRKMYLFVFCFLNIQINLCLWQKSAKKICWLIIEYE